eukprot:SAG11_NODE_2584_length_3195_cov_2.145026_5_plen_80_part_00
MKLRTHVVDGDEREEEERRPAVTLCRDHQRVQKAHVEWRLVSNLKHRVQRATKGAKVPIVGSIKNDVPPQTPRDDRGRD